MSRWTHIRGGFELVSGPYEMIYTTDEKGKKRPDFKKSKLPYPEEQVKLYTPDILTNKNKAVMTIDMSLMSLPRAKKYIDEGFKLLPQGEGKLEYFVNQNPDSHRSSASFLEFKSAKKAFEKAVEKTYGDSKWGHLTYKELKDFHNTELGWVEDAFSIHISFRDDIRYASANDIFKGLEEMFNYLEKNEIHVEDGYLEWEDEYINDKIFAWRYSRVSLNNECHQYMILDKTTNAIIASKIQYGEWKDEEYQTHWEESDNWVNEINKIC